MVKPEIKPKVKVVVPKPGIPKKEISFKKQVTYKYSARLLVYDGVFKAPYFER